MFSELICTTFRSAWPFTTPTDALVSLITPRFTVGASPESWADAASASALAVSRRASCVALVTMPPFGM